MFGQPAEVPVLRWTCTAGSDASLHMRSLVVRRMVSAGAEVTVCGRAAGRARHCGQAVSVNGCMHAHIVALSPRSTFPCMVRL